VTGKDLIIYILENGLLDEPVFKDGRILGFMTVMEAAVKFGVGVSTVKLWVQMGSVYAIKLGDEIYIPADAQSPMMKGE
jgi:excisionase family DNA binding protein